MNKPYLYANTAYRSNRAVVVLPEIFGVTDFIKRTVDRFADEFKLSAFALDHFYAVTGKCEVFDYSTDMTKGVEIMNRMRGEDFVALFTKALDEIQAEQPGITEFVVVGFCFGGRLAYLAGIDERVSKVVSFYGGQAHAPNYYQGKTPVQALAAARGGSELQMLSLYGGQDASISAEDRAKTKEALGAADIDYIEKVYDKAGHAYFNDSRPAMYNAEASQKSWVEIMRFLH